MKRIRITPIEAEVMVSALTRGSGDRKVMGKVALWTERFRELAESDRENLSKMATIQITSQEWADAIHRLLRATPREFLVEDADLEMLLRAFDSRKDWAFAYARVINTLSFNLEKAEDVDPTTIVDKEVSQQAK